jgi:death-on-curing protein
MLLAHHGGQAGIRDQGAVEAALARLKQLEVYGEPAPDAAALAAAYAFGLARNHAFIDGNKRIAWVVARLLLADNGHMLRFDAANAIHTVECVAAGTITEVQLADWFRQRLI